MKLTVLSVAFPRAPVRDDVAGGAEQVLLALDRSLVNAGHRSVVVACEGSSPAGELIVGHADCYRDTIAAAIQKVTPDVVHYHGLDFRDYFVAAAMPSVITLHMPAEFYPDDLPSVPGLFYQCVSASQRNGFSAQARFVDTIENGVDVRFFRPSSFPRQHPAYAVSLGRICPEKGFHLALDAAREAGVAMFLAGETFPYPDHQRYFQQQIEPRLDCARRFIGTIGSWKKRSLLSSARCVIIPSLVSETSSVVAMEALACGTPVVARAVGALPSIVEDGQTGWLADTTEGIARAIRKCVSIDRQECRRVAEARFSSGRMFCSVSKSLLVTCLVLEIARTFEELEALAPEWEALCIRTPQAAVFQLPQWLLPWWKHFGGGEIFTPMLRKGGQLKAIAPMFFHGMPGENIRQLSFIGTGISDYLDFIAEPAVAKGFADGVRERLDHEPWDVWNLEELQPGAHALVLGQSTDLSSCPVIELPESIDEFYRSLDATHRRNVRRSRKDFGYQTKRMDGFSEFVRLHELSWKDRGEAGVLNCPNLQDFYREASQALDAIGILRVHTLLLDQQVVAAILAFHFGGKGYAYLGGFDPRFKKLSPGTAILGYAIEQGIRDGLREWDLLRGEEGYKLLWGAKARINRRVRIERAVRNTAL